MDPTRPERCAKRRAAAGREARRRRWSPGALARQLGTRVSLHRLCHATWLDGLRVPALGDLLTTGERTPLTPSVAAQHFSTLTARALRAPYSASCSDPPPPVRRSHPSPSIPPHQEERLRRGLVRAPKLPRIPTAPPRPITPAPGESLPVRRELHSLAWRPHTGPFSAAAGQPQHRWLQNRTQARLARSDGAVQRSVHRPQLHECVHPAARCPPARCPSALGHGTARRDARPLHSKPDRSL